MQPGDLIIVAARPSMGKTTFAMNLVESVLQYNKLPALVFYGDASRLNCDASNFSYG